MCHPFVNQHLQKPLIHKVNESNHQIKGNASWAPIGYQYICHPYSTDQQERKLQMMKDFSFISEGGTSAGVIGSVDNVWHS
jgi:hypothetical protein